MSKRIIIVGGGRVGHHAAAELVPDKYTVTVVERDPEQCSSFPGHLAHGIVGGDGTDPEVFERADPASAAAVLAVTDNVETNLAVCELAKEYSEDIWTMVRIARDGEQDYAHLGHVDNVIYPPAIAAKVAVERVEANLSSSS